MKWPRKWRSNLTPEQKEIFIDIARVGMTFFPEAAEQMILKAYEAFAAFMDLTSPKEEPYTLEEIGDLVTAQSQYCAFPTCFERKCANVIPGLEKTALRLCDKHKNCMRCPDALEVRTDQDS